MRIGRKLFALACNEIRGRFGSLSERSGISKGCSDRCDRRGTPMPMNFNRPEDRAA